MKILALSIFLTLLSSSAIGGTVVIVNKSNPVTNLSKDEVRKIFLAKTRRFDSGVKAQPVDQKKKSDVHKNFYTKVAGKSPRQIHFYWSRLVFTGKGKPPKSLSDDSSVKAFVAESEGGIGYISEKNVDGTVKVVLKVD